MFGTAWTLAIALTLGVADGTDKTTPQAPVKQPPAVVWSDDRPLTRFFPNLLHDLRALPSVNSAVVLVTGGAGAAAIHPADDNFADWAERSGERYTQLGEDSATAGRRQEVRWRRMPSASSRTRRR